jgi:hypothetical protein
MQETFANEDRSRNRTFYEKRKIKQKKKKQGQHKKKKGMIKRKTR